MSNTKNSGLSNLFNYVNDSIKSINESKLFAGLMIVFMNVASKFVTIKMSKSMEAYLKYTFSRNVLIFTISWIGSRDLITAFGITALFIFVIDYLLNENSVLCILPAEFIDHHTVLVSEQFITREELDKAISVIERADSQLNGAMMTNNII